MGLPTWVFLPRSPYLALGFTPLHIHLSIDNASGVCDAMTVVTGGENFEGCLSQLAMFLYAMRHGVATGAMCEHFQHSLETISFYVNRVIKAIALLRFTYIVLPSGTDPVHPHIRHDDRFYPYFKDAIGAIDGTYIPPHVLKDRQARYRNRKNVISQNVMGVCGFCCPVDKPRGGMNGSLKNLFR
ncbi:hypothetical protein Taro_016732 [Colocasia esculenta]|uniref:DUF8040 domain-containing protein n=1 Tax=Colocasia esculenta TaxID=4460 RepID=A0A843ULI8_COLES|nr:hypothetical protein [Colocasia esculenta]